MLTKELKVEDVPVSSIKPYSGNAKKHTREQVDQICASIREFGFNDPLGVWTNEAGELEIVEGHGRALAAQKLGMETVPVIRLDSLTDAQRRAYTLAHNQLTMNTGWDMDQLSYELDTLAESFDMAGFGFDELEREVETSELDEVDPDDEVADTVERGQVWRIGSCRLMCGDSTKQEDVDRLLDGEEVALLLTDPPYNVALGQHNRPSEAKQLHRRTDGLVIENDSWENDEQFVEFLTSCYSAAMPYLKAGGGILYLARIVADG